MSRPTSNRSPYLVSVVAAAALPLTGAGACGDQEPLDASPEHAAEARQGESFAGALEGPTAGEAVDMGEEDAGAASPYDFQAIAPCLAASAYMSRGVVRFGLGQPPFTPPCVRLATGGTVVFQGDLDQHPLEPRPLGTWPSPLQSTVDGSLAEFEFSSAGFFPYRCSKHPNEIGVIWASLY